MIILDNIQIYNKQQLQIDLYLYNINKMQPNK